MVVDHNMSEMVGKQMSETETGLTALTPIELNLQLDSLEQYATALVNAVAGGVDREAAAYDLTPTEFAAVRLFLTDLEWTATELAQMLSVDASSMSRVVSKLVDRGVLRRRAPARGPADGVPEINGRRRRPGAGTSQESTLLRREAHPGNQS